MAHRNTRDRQLLDEIDAELIQSHAADDDGALETLRTILFGEYHGQIDQLQIDLNRLRSTVDAAEQQFQNDTLFTQRISPIIAPAIMTSIQESRAAMVEALYPIIGQMVVRAVTEAMRDLSRRIDQQMRIALSMGSLFERLQARLHGVSGNSLVLRQALPFDVQEIFLIHRVSGLLLHHLSHDLETHLDSDLISGMLTAIHDFAQNVLGHDTEDQLDQIQYGGKVILLEAAQQVYIAVVIAGIEPTGYRAKMREHVLEINLAHQSKLRNYEGDASHFLALATQLAVLMNATDDKTVSREIIERKVSEREATQQAAQPPTAVPKQVSPTSLVMVGMLLLFAFLLILLLWQLHSTPPSLFNLSIRSIL